MTSNLIDTAARNRLIRDHITLAKRIARSFAARVPRSVGYDDIEATAFLGLTEAAVRYDRQVNELFAPYASKWVRGAILDDLRRRDVLTRRRREQAKRLAVATRECEARSGEAATAADVAVALNMSESDVQQLRSRAFVPRLVPLNEERHVPTSATAPIAPDRVDEKQRLRILVQAIGSLPTRDRTIIEMYYEESMTLRHIGVVLGVTESRVCQLRRRAERAMRSFVTERLSPRTVTRQAA